MVFSVPQQARTTLFRQHILGLAPFAVLVLTWWASTLSALRLAIELLHARPRFSKDLRKSIRLVDTIALQFSLSLPSGKKNFLFPLWPMTHFMTFRTTKKQKIATRPLLDKLHKQDFAGPLSSRDSRILGPISRYRVADILLHMKLVSRASRPGLLVGFLRILCNGLCAAQGFHTEEHDHTCRVGCPNEPDSHTLQGVSLVV